MATYKCNECDAEMKRPGLCRECYTGVLERKRDSSLKGPVAKWMEKRKKKAAPANDDDDTKTIRLRVQGRPVKAGSKSNLYPVNVISGQPITFTTTLPLAWVGSRRELCFQCAETYDAAIYTMCPHCNKDTDFSTQKFSGEGILGIRVFTLNKGYSNNVYLRGGFATAWPTPHMTAECKAISTISFGQTKPTPYDGSDGPCPHISHKCGINAYRPDSLTHPSCDFTVCVIDSRQRYVFGICRLWGRIIEHEDGVRASHCEVIAIVEPSERYFGEIESSQDCTMSQVIRNFPAWGAVPVHKFEGSWTVNPIPGEEFQVAGKLIEYLQEVSLQYATPLTEEIADSE